MFGIVFLSLLVSVAATGGLILMAAGKVAFAGPGNYHGIDTGPIGRGSAAGRRPDGIQLALRLERAVSQVMSHLGWKAQPTPVCESVCHGREIQVTTPEVLAIVQELRSHKSAGEIEAIHHRAMLNLQNLEGSGECPLLLAGGFCACDGARPVACRTRCIAGADSPLEARKLAETVASDVTDMFRDCLSTAGLDSSRYELNYALSRVLETSDAAQRWAQGDPVLQSS